MAEYRKPGAGPKRGPGRRVVSRPSAIPRWAYVALIVGPSVGIVILIAFSILRGSGGNDGEPLDPNAEIARLQSEIPILRKELQEVNRLLQQEDPRAKARVEKLRERYFAWIETWEAIFESQRDEEGNLPSQLEGYAPLRRDVNMDLNDLNRIAPF